MADHRDSLSFGTRSALLIVILLAVLLATNGSPVAAIEDGWLAEDTALNRATVHVGTSGSTCSGVLVASNLVLAARHCFRHEPPTPAPHDPRGGGFEDWQFPDRFYSLDHIYPNGVDVHVGLDRTNPLVTTTAREYSLPGNVDVALLKLATAIPAGVARPVEVITDLDSYPGSGPIDIETLSFSVFGFGKTGVNEGFATQLQEGRSGSGEYPCPRQRNGWTQGDVHRICVAGSSGGVRNGDSGGPLYWDTDAARFLVGVFQGLESERNGGRYVATFFRGGVGNDGSPRGDVGGWLDQHLTPFRVRNAAKTLFSDAWI
ncbi:MAG: trypsin-like serine protease [Acidimicrobiales bacterium]